MHSKDDCFSKAQDELLIRIKSTYRKRNSLSPIGKDEQQYIDQVLKTCEQYFAAVQKRLDSQVPLFLLPNEQESSDCPEKDTPNFAENNVRKLNEKSETNPSKESNTRMPTYLSKKFSPFYIQYLQKVLSPFPLDSSIVSLLPYFLAAYYINTLVIDARLALTYLIALSV